MFAHTQKFIADFYQKNLFERIIIYFLLGEFLTKSIFEFGLGQYHYLLPLHKQWFFFGFLALDYLVSFRKVMALRITLNPVSLFAFLFLIMVVHGLFVGFMNHNAPFIIFNDTIPPFILALNIWRMQSESEYTKPIDFNALLLSSTLLTAGTCFFGIFTGFISLPSPNIYYPLILVGFFMVRPFPKWIFVVAVFILVATIFEMNRTSIASVAIAISGYCAVQTLVNPLRALITVLVALLCIVVGWNLIPEESGTYARIVGLTEIDLSKRTGSVGERQAEQDAVRAKLKSKGETVEWVGLGFGGLYEVQLTHQFKDEYGHAHYAWVWFTLRFGKIGYIYMICFIGMLLYNGVRSLMQGDKIGIFVALLCLQGILYCVTHVNSVWLLSGAHFLYRSHVSREKEEVI